MIRDLEKYKTQVERFNGRLYASLAIKYFSSVIFTTSLFSAIVKEEPSSIPLAIISASIYGYANIVRKDAENRRQVLMEKAKIEDARNPESDLLSLF